MTPTLLPYGARAVLLELPDASARRALTHWLQQETTDGVDVIPAETTVLLDVSDLTVDDATARLLLAKVTGKLRDLDVEALPQPTSSTAPPTPIDVVYDGPDLAAVAKLLGRSTEALIAWHTETPWNVEFLGFMPGFGYLTRDDHTTPIDRHRSPRRAIPTGSVGFAGSYCGIYPGSSPGGWQLVGRTDATLFDATGDGALLAAGGTVRFRAVR